MQDAQVDVLISQLRCRRDVALIRLILDGGLRPDEMLGLHLTDIAYGRRRVTVRVRFDHPCGVRSMGPPRGPHPCGAGTRMRHATALLVIFRLSITHLHAPIAHAAIGAGLAACPRTSPIDVRLSDADRVQRDEHCRPRK